MGFRTIQIRLYKPEEIIFDDDEIRTIAKFFFQSPSKQRTIDDLELNDRMCGYVQGLLVAAIDASTGMAIIEAVNKLFNLKPAADAKALKKIFRKVVLNTAKLGFKNAKIRNLEDVKIYENIRSTIDLYKFSELLGFEASNCRKNKAPVALSLDTNAEETGFIWGFTC